MMALSSEAREAIAAILAAAAKPKAEAKAAAEAATNLYVYLEHAIGSGPLIYSLFEIALPNPLPPLPTAAPPVKVKPLPNPNPILQLKLGEYPRGMCCVQLGSKFYLFGGQYDDLDLCDYGDIDEEIKKKYSNVTRDDYPRDVYIFDPTTTAAADADDDKLMKAAMMNTGKSNPVAFAVDEKIYVLGSTFTFEGGDKIKNLAEKEAIKEQALFEMYDPSDDKWTVLPNPPPIICDVENKKTEWVGHAVDLEEARKRKRVLLLARQGLYSCLYSFDLDGGQWIKCLTLPRCPATTFVGRCELVGGFLYGHSYDTVAAFKVPLAGNENLDDDDEEIKEKMEDSPDKRAWWEMTLAEKCPFYYASKEMGMDAIYKFPRQLYSSSSLLHLGNGFFCFVLSGMPPHPYISIEGAVEDYKKRVISIVIFQNPHVGDDQTEEKYFKAKFVHSAHYVINSPFPIDGRIRGCFSLGQVFDFGGGSRPTFAEHCMSPQTEVASLKKAWDSSSWYLFEESRIAECLLQEERRGAAECLLREERQRTERLLQEERQRTERLLQEERHSAERRLQYLQREHERTIHLLRMEITRLTVQRDLILPFLNSSQATSDPVEPASSSQLITEKLVSNPSGDTTNRTETLHLS
ncbi:hypothetical protein SO802_005446 [Lithocarpus litseifolius]|uniref:Uncharacterized protein n=1 Tax=Lithocarpus litseifolius TaxID=425828 RepID=A0AAW2DI69_9ROSI